MSSARKQGCELTRRAPAGWSDPRRYGIRGCMPDPVKSVVGSSRGTRLAGGTTVCPRATKNSMYARRMSALFIFVFPVVAAEPIGDPRPGLRGGIEGEAA